MLIKPVDPIVGLVAAIEKSKVFKLIQKLPKGASLHSHDTGIASEDYVYSLTFRENLYACKSGGLLQFKFFKNSHSVDNTCEWKSVKEWRQTSPGFDTYLMSQLTLTVENPAERYPDLDAVWKEFLNRFSVVHGLVTYKPIFVEYFYQVLKELHDDNVQYLEMRGLLPEVYDLEGKIYGPEEVTGLYVEALNKFKADYPKFHGARLIYAPTRFANNSTMDVYLNVLKGIQGKYQDFVAGFDLVGQEDKGRPLVDFIPQLLEIKNTTRFFFHAGETNWEGDTDMNLFDAVLLNTTRIGHGYAIVKHPEVYQVAKERKIAVEISPISNQVLKLVDDYRNHPAAALIADGFPVVIACDDPSFWDSKALSYDWYIAFMAFGSRDSDLRLLKQLAINSILYSSLEDDERSGLLNEWEKRWDQFLDDILEVKLSYSIETNEIL